MKSRGGAEQLGSAFPPFTAAQKEDLTGVETNIKTGFMQERSNAADGFINSCISCC